MSNNSFMQASRRSWASLLILAGICASGTSSARAQVLAGPQSIIHQVTAANDRLDMTIHSSRMLTLDLKIPRAQVNNPDLLDLTPVSARQVQVYAKKAGVTQVNLWDENGDIHMIDVVIYGDVRELSMTLQAQFPNASIKVFPTATSVILSGYVDRPDHVTKIIRMAEDYYPKVINNITVGGAQQVLLHVKVMEVSRTKLRNLGFDFAQFSSGDFVTTGIGGILTKASSTTPINRTASSFTTTGKETVQFGVLNANASFFGFIQALQQNQLIKTLAEPTLVTVSGRPAYFQAGGQLPYPVPSGLGTTTIAFKDYGTQVDFVPIVLGNGNIRLEVRPQVSEIDNSVAININGTSVPGFTTRVVDTGVEMKVGQTLALAGLIQTRLESSKQSLPWIGDLPILGMPFRAVLETINEVELLILVRPELAEAMDCDEVPPRGPGQNSEMANDIDFYGGGHLEVPLPTPGPGGGPGGGPGAPGGPTGLMPGTGPGVPVPPAGKPAEVLPPGQPVLPQSSDLPPQDGTTGQASRRFSDTAAAPGSSRAQSATGVPRNYSANKTPPASGALPKGTAAGPYNPAKPDARQTGPRISDSEPPGFIGSTGYDVVN